MLIIGDVHGKIDQYNEIASQSEKSVCLGDVGFDYSGITLDPLKHRIIGGNHDNYDKLSKHFLGDFGEYDGMFYVRGAWSPDFYYRIEGINWWKDEELSYGKLQECLELYAQICPDIVLTHDCPARIKRELIGEEPRDRTSLALDMMLEYHQPTRWIYGHHHIYRLEKVNGTWFECVPELGTTTI